MLVYTPAKPATSIPVVDLDDSFSPNPERRQAVAREIHKACRDTGFFYAANHGIPGEVLADQLEWARQFFALPLETKLEINMEKSSGPRGYEPLQRQTLDAGSPPDLKEGFQFDADTESAGPGGYRGRNLWPSGLPGFREQMADYHRRVKALGIHLTRCLALSLDLPAEYFDDGLSELMCSVRLLHYPPHPATAAFNQLGAGAHTDWGSVTMLLQDDCGGLEVLSASGDWILAKPIPGTLIINLGDMVRRWTNDLYHSTMHRVLNNISGRDRYSVATFFNPAAAYRVECVPTCRPENGPPNYEPCTVGEHLAEMFRRTYAKAEA